MALILEIKEYTEHYYFTPIMKDINPFLKINHLESFYEPILNHHFIVEDLQFIFTH